MRVESGGLDEDSSNKGLKKIDVALTFGRDSTLTGALDMSEKREIGK